MMQRERETCTYIDVTPGELHDRAAAYKDQGWRYENTNATVAPGEDAVELLCFFSHGPRIEALRTTLAEGDHIDSLSDLFFSAFVFENEAHDLFGVNFDGLAIDFKGTFYKMAVTSPMTTLPSQAPAAKRPPQRKA